MRNFTLKDCCFPINDGKYILSELDPFNLPAGLDNLVATYVEARSRYDYRATGKKHDGSAESRFVRRTGCPGSIPGSCWSRCPQTA